MNGNLRHDRKGIVLTFTYDLSTDIGKVRLRVGDRVELTDDDGNLLDTGIRSDEEIQSLIDTSGSWQGGCVGWVQSVLIELNQEADSTQDWLELDFESARESYKDMLDDLRDEFDLPTKSSPAPRTVTVLGWRSDTYLTDPN